MDCPPGFWLNRIIDWVRQKAACMSEKKTRIVKEESRNAVIKARRNEVSPEHFVIAYRDEESSRELIVGQAAVALIPNSSSTDADSQNIREKPAFRREADHRGHQSPRQHLLPRVGLTETRRIACAILQNAVVAGALLFYSRSVLGAVIRASVSAS
jgi:hypothetical protein